MRVARFVSICALLGALAPAGAHAEPAQSHSPSDVEAARIHYRRGVELYEQGKYEEALGELQRADSLAPTYRLLYDIALVQRQLGDAAGALRSFGSYLDAGAEVPPSRRAEVERAIVELTAKVATIDVTSNVPGTEIRDDDRVMGTTPLAAPLRLNPGPHRIGASKAGYRQETRSIDVVGGDRVELPFSLQEIARSAPALPLPSPAPSRPPLPAVDEALPLRADSPPRADRIALRADSPWGPPPERPRPTWIGWTATGVLAAGAVVTGIAALVQSHTLRSEINDEATSAATIRSTHATTATLAVVSDVLTGSAVAAAGITLYVKLHSKPRSSSSSASSSRASSSPTSSAPPSFPLRAELRAAPGSVWLSATF